MIICETIGLFIIAIVCIGLLVFLCSVFISGSPEKVDEGSVAGSFFVIIAIFLLLASIFFVQFRHHPEQFGYTEIEEVEEVEETE